MSNPNDVLAGVDDASIYNLMGALAEYQAQRQTRTARQAALTNAKAKLAHYRQLRTALALLQAELRAAEAAGLTLPVPLAGGQTAAQAAADAEQAQDTLRQAMRQGQAIVVKARAQADEIAARAAADAAAIKTQAQAEAAALLANGRAQAEDLLTVARGEAAALMTRSRKALQDAEAAVAAARLTATAPEAPARARPRPDLPPGPALEPEARPAAPVARPVVTPAPVPMRPAAVAESILPAPAGPADWDEFRHSTPTAFEPFTVQRDPAQLTVEPTVSEEGALTGIVVTLMAGGETDARVCAIRRALPAEGGVPLLKGMAFTLSAGGCRARIEAGSDLRVGQSQAMALHLRYQLIPLAGEVAPILVVGRPPAAQPDQLDRATAEAPAEVSPTLVGLVQSEDGF